MISNIKSNQLIINQSQALISDFFVKNQNKKINSKSDIENNGLENYLILGPNKISEFYYFLNSYNNENLNNINYNFK